MTNKVFNEDSRVKIPAVIHSVRLGYKYQTKKLPSGSIDAKTNIFKEVFKRNVERINSVELSDAQIDELLKELASLADNKIDLGEAYLNRLKRTKGIKLIDFDNPDNNEYLVVTELSYSGERDSFRPDITFLINGIPVSFLEVKKPNNQGYTNNKGITKYGIQAEFNRMDDRFRNPEFIPYFNMMQIISFSNNLPYDDGTTEPLQGSFYTTPNGSNTMYNHFREEREIAVSEYLSDEIIDSILTDNNISSIRYDLEFNDNMKIDTPTNSFITSIYSPERLLFFIKYGLVYVNSQRDGRNKHVIRYQQYFALQNLLDKLKKSTELSNVIGDSIKTVLWHTQGSGKTAFAYFASNVLRDFYSAELIVTKFYFIVDRLDLLTQSSIEFADRGMTIAKIKSKVDFASNIASPAITDISSQRGLYKETMNVVNIQKFSEESKVDLKGMKGIQRIYFIDEVHRGYKEAGIFLANLLGADPNGLFIGLTGTPILAKKETDNDGNLKIIKLGTTDFFDSYLHKYYYNKSIADGYTLPIKKENISTRFKSDVKKMLKVPEDKPVPSSKWNIVTSAEEFIAPLGTYVEEDFKNFRTVTGDLRNKELGFMIVAASLEQAIKLQRWFENNSDLKTCLVLSEEDDNAGKQTDYRGHKNKETGLVESTYDGIIVFRMCITGFDAPRLKRLYLLRTIKEHSLLQTLSRVNRPFNHMKYGYIVDFVDITEEYEETNRRYLEELRADIEVDELSDTKDIFVNVEAVKSKIRELDNNLFIYMYNIETNLEAFSKQIRLLDEKTVRNIRSYLEQYKECYNELRMSYEDVSKIPITEISKALSETNNRIAIIMASKALDDDVAEYDFSGLVVEFLRGLEIDLDFMTENDVLEIITRIQNAFSSNTDKEDPECKDALKNYKCCIKRFKQDADSVEKVKNIIKELNGIYSKVLIINNENNALTSRYRGDETCMRVHKKFRGMYSGVLNEVQIFEIITKISNAMQDEVGHMPDPTSPVIIRKMLRHLRRIYLEYGIKLTPRMAQDIIEMFLEDKYKK